MTALLPDSTTRPTAGELRRDLGGRRPLVVLATLTGVLAAASTLLVCLALGVVGWFLTEAGGHGMPRDGLRTGALAWLMAHGSGVVVDGVAVTAMPLGITLACAWATWRIGHKLGDAVSGHGPDMDRLADGERDWTVPVAVVVFTAGYVVVATLTATLAATPATDPSLPRVLLWSLALCVFLGAPGIAVGSGRAAIWTATLPRSVAATGAAFRRVITTWLLVAFLALALALLLDYDTALNVTSQLHTDTGATVLLGVVTFSVLPNAAIWSGAYLLGPGFTVGVHTIVSPAEVSIGALPMFPLLAALPDTGPTPGWTPLLVVVPPLVAAIGVARAQRRYPTLRWEEGPLHGCAGGMLAGALFGLLAALAGGAVGPGRMADVGPLAFDVLVHGITAFGIGGLVGGLAMTWWQRRTARRRGLETARAAPR